MLEFIKSYGLEFLLGLITGALTLMVKQLYSRFKAYDAGMKAMLKFRLFKECNKYIALNSITVDEMETLDDLYAGYHGMGMNHTGDELYLRCKKLPIIPYRTQTTVVLSERDCVFPTPEKEIK